MPNTVSDKWRVLKRERALVYPASSKDLGEGRSAILKDVLFSLVFPSFSEISPPL